MPKDLNYMLNGRKLEDIPEMELVFSSILVSDMAPNIMWTFITDENGIITHKVKTSTCFIWEQLLSDLKRLLEKDSNFFNKYGVGSYDLED